MLFKLNALKYLPIYQYSNMWKICSPVSVKILVDYQAVFLVTFGAVLIISGIGYSIDCAEAFRLYGYTCNGYEIGISVTGVCFLFGGILLLFGIIKGKEIPIIIYLVLYVIALKALSIYFFYYAYKQLVVYASSASSKSQVVLSLVALIFEWWVHFSLYLFYKEMKERRRFNSLTSTSETELCDNTDRNPSNSDLFD